MLYLTWYGHAAFLLGGEAEDGMRRRVILNTYCAPERGRL